MAKSQRLHAFSWLGVILSIIALSVFGFIGAKSTLDYNYCKELQTAIDKGIIVEAEIVALVHTSGGKNSGSIYNIMYRYTDQDGIVYESYCGRGNYETEAEDRKRIGEKVNVYIGGLSATGRPLSRAVCYGTEVDVSLYIIVMSVFYSAIVLYIFAVILYCLFFYNKLPFQKKKFDKTENFS